MLLLLLLVGIAVVVSAFYYSPGRRSSLLCFLLETVLCTSGSFVLSFLVGDIVRYIFLFIGMYTLCYFGYRKCRWIVIGALAAIAGGLLSRFFVELFSSLTSAGLAGKSSTALVIVSAGAVIDLARVDETLLFIAVLLLGALTGRGTGALMWRNRDHHGLE